jgi:ribosomal protein S12 methylthiotransferase accessory factor
MIHAIRAVPLLYRILLPYYARSALYKGNASCRPKGSFQTMNLGDERPLWEILGLAVLAGMTWKALRIGKLKTLLALAVGDREAAREGCEWVDHYRQMNHGRWLVYRCVEARLNLDEPAGFRHSLTLLYGPEASRQAEALLDATDRFFRPDTRGADMQGSAIHGKLLAACDKPFA